MSGLADPPYGDEIFDEPETDQGLLAELEEAEYANYRTRPCQVCTGLESMSDQARANVERALAGTIGERKLSDILTRNGYPAGRRAIRNHRSEGHTS